MCAYGLYLYEGGSIECDTCVSGGICEGGYIPMYPDKHVH